MLTSAQMMIRRAAKQLDMSDEAVGQLLRPNAEHIFDIEVNGHKHAGYRIQHDNTRGPYKGGIRFHPQVDLNEVRAMAMLMSLKTAAVGLPLGGGKGGVVIDAKVHDKSHLEAVSRVYVQNLHPHIGPDKDVPAPDVSTDAETMDWMVDEYEKLTGDTSRASFTGKSIDKGGSEGREQATGRGGVIVLREYLKTLPGMGKPLTIAVQGIGNVGFYFAKLAAEQLPVRIVAVSNSKQTLSIRDFATNSYNLDFSDKKFSRKIAEELANDKTESLGRDAILRLNVDVLVLAALENSVTADNIDNVQAQILVELANGPVTDEAHSLLTANGRVVVPDIIANAGGVIVSYLEWLQNKNGEHWSETRVNTELDQILSKASTLMLERAKSENISLKQAAFENALENLKPGL